MADSAPRQRPGQIVLTVIRTERLTPRMVCVVLGGAGFDEFVDTEFTDKYAKLFFVKPELRLAPPFDIPALRERLPPEDWPVVRTYTIRSVDEDARELTIDFVVHGDSGVAAPWAANAQPGDTLVLAGPSGAFAPDPTADGYVFVGDASAMPAIAAALERLPTTAHGEVVLEIEDAEERQDLTAPPGIRFHWVVRDSSEYDPTRLAAAAELAHWPEGRVQLFIHGEREAVKALRGLSVRHGVPRELLSISGYWAHGRTEDTFQAEKREPVGKILD